MNVDVVVWTACCLVLDVASCLELGTCLMLGQVVPFLALAVLKVVPSLELVVLKVVPSLALAVWQVVGSAQHSLVRMQLHILLEL